MLALKDNQGTFYDDVKLYIADTDLLGKCEHTTTVEKAHNCLE